MAAGMFVPSACICYRDILAHGALWNNRCLGYGYALKMDWLAGQVGRQSVNDGVASFGQARNVNFGYVIRRFVRL
jgi:hypothetical protein